MLDGTSILFPAIGLALGAAVVGVVVARARRGRGGAGGPGTSGGGDAERRLRATAGDAAAERLIRFELGRSPGLSRGDAAERAYDRLIADRTR